MAAGQTPSPEMVANAEGAEGLRPAVAVALLAIVIAAMLAFAVGHPGNPLEHARFEASPEALAAIARGHARSFGHTGRAAASAMGIEPAPGYRQYARLHWTSREFAAHLASSRPAPLTFWYRESPGLMVPGDTDFHVTPDRPGFDVSGMWRMRLDLEGRLLQFEALPRQVEAPAGSPPPPPDWTPLFAAAVLDAAQLRPVAPEWTPSMAFDRRDAWTGAWPALPEMPIRVEAASWRGKPVSFQIVEPWTTPLRDQPRPPGSEAVNWAVVQWLILFPAALFLGARNVRSKRADVGGAWRLGSVIVVLEVARNYLTMTHVPGAAEVGRLLTALAIPMLLGSAVAAAYLALEPFVRRRYPRLLVAWARLLRGDWRDPLLAANVLAGFAAGSFVIAIGGLGLYFKERMGIIRILPPGEAWSAVLGGRQFLGLLLIGRIPNAVELALAALLLFFLLRLLARGDLGAGIAMVALGVLLSAASVENAAVDLSFAALGWGVLAFVMIRFGIPAVIAFLSMLSAPLWLCTADTSRWYFGYGVVIVVSVIAVAAVAFRIALGGRRLLRDESLT